MSMVRKTNDGKSKKRMALLSNQMASSPLGGTAALALPEAEA
jgi:hypothetical protein